MAGSMSLSLSPGALAAGGRMGVQAGKGAAARAPKLSPAEQMQKQAIDSLKKSLQELNGTKSQKNEAMKDKLKELMDRLNKLDQLYPKGATAVGQSDPKGGGGDDASVPPPLEKRPPQLRPPEAAERPLNIERVRA